MSDQNCIVCFRQAFFFSTGVCEHPVCYECSARMRVLLMKNDCPICRNALDTVIFTKGIKTYKEIEGSKLKRYIYKPSYGIYIEDDELDRRFEELLVNRCNYCETAEKPIFRDFESYRQHVQRTHELFVCELCVEFIKLFPRERRFYSRQDLGFHKRKGDKNDRSHRGHPLCHFCDKRYFDTDELYKHLRKDHYFCHFCDADGLNDYYNTYDDLRVHFRKSHFLCEEENCKEEKFTSVFRTEIDLKAHLTAVHSKLLGKHGVKQARSLDLEFALPPRIEDERRNRRHQNQRPYRGRDIEESIEEVLAYEPPMVPLPTIDPQSTQDFPSLGGSSGPKLMVSNGAAQLSSSIAQKIALSSGKNVQSSGGSISHQKGSIGTASWTGKVSGSTRMEEEFPSLPGSTGGTYSGNHTSFTSKVALSQQPPQQPKLKGPIPQRNVPGKDEFPGLPTASKSKAAPTNGSAWTRQKPKSEGKGKKIAPAPVLDSPNKREETGDFNFVPLSFTKNKREEKLSKELQAEASQPPGDEIVKKTKKKNQRPDEPSNALSAAAANALFNGGSLQVAKTAAQGKNNALPPSQEHFPSLEPLKNSLKKSQQGSSGPPPGFSVGSSTRPPGFRNPPDTSNFLRNNNSIYLGALKAEVEDHDVYLKKFLASNTSSLYTQPPDFMNRNANLYEAIQTSLGRNEESCDLFRKLSNEYKKGELSPDEYYDLAQDIFGPTDFRIIFPELVTLLPNIPKQQDLLSSHRKKGGNMNSLIVCKECFQVLKFGDNSVHQKTHADGEAFPSL